MIEPRDFLLDVVDPPLAALSEAMGRDMASEPARVMLLAIALQESWLQARLQGGGGPARGFWQFERGGGTRGVLEHAASQAAARAVCDALYVPAELDTVFEALAWHDHLACCWARLLLFTDPGPLPGVGREDQAWACYLANWRPGKPDRARWAKAYPLAVNTVLQERSMRISPVDPAALPRGAMVVTPAETVVAPASNPLKPDARSAAFWAAIALSVLPAVLDAANAAVASNPAVASMPWVGGAIYVAAQLRKIAALIQLPGVRAPEPK